nr:uncharacterized protein LOC127340642 [Lolium perenne]
MHAFYFYILTLLCLKFECSSGCEIRGNLKKMLAKAESELSNCVLFGVMAVLYTTVSTSSGRCFRDDSVLLWLQPYWLHQTHHADHLPGNLKKLLAKAESELSNRVCSGVMMVLYTTVSASSICCCGDDSVLLWLQPYLHHQTHHADHLPGMVSRRRGRHGQGHVLCLIFV